MDERGRRGKGMRVGGREGKSGRDEEQRRDVWVECVK